jgi:hypothetical protein
MGYHPERSEEPIGKNLILFSEKLFPRKLMMPDRKSPSGEGLALIE